MEQKRLNELTYNVLVNASQMAYVEEAGDTFTLLQNFNDLFRYMIRNLELVTLYSELEVLKKYISIQKMRYGNRFSVTIENDEENKPVFIKHLSIIDFFDSVIYKALDEFEKPIIIKIEVEGTQDKCLKIILESCDTREVYTKQL